MRNRNRYQELEWHAQQRHKQQVQHILRVQERIAISNGTYRPRKLSRLEYILTTACILLSCSTLILL